MPATALDDLYDYDPAYLADILKSVKSIAMESGLRCPEVSVDTNVVGSSVAPGGRHSFIQHTHIMHSMP